MVKFFRALAESTPTTESGSGVKKRRRPAMKASAREVEENIRR
jgi:hypothetical protein